MRVLIISLLFVSCAGPIMPFGSVDLKDKWSLKEAQKVNTHIRDNGLIHRSIANVYPTFSVMDKPSLLFHKPYGFTFIIPKDSRVVPMMMLGEDIIPFEILSNVSINQRDDLLEYKVKNIKLSSNTLYDLKLLLVDQFGQTIDKVKLSYPNCRMYKKEKLQNLWSFNVDEKIKQSLFSIEDRINISTVLLASVVAQESTFNPKALSWAKAVGLTQVTPIAQKEIAQLNPHWPVDKRLSNNKYLSIKWLLERGRITSKDDWRLDYMKSLIGGSLFLEKVSQYWLIPENAKLITGYSQKDVLAVVLASYNSGPYRVKKQIKKLKRNWLKSRKLEEARKYVQNIFSYCHEFKQTNQVVSKL